jgi:hypothetical protein
MNDGITIERKNDKVNIILDMSMWDLFELCKARYHYRHGLNRAVPITKKSQSLDAGSVAHEGLDVYFNGIKKNLHYNDRMQQTLMKMRQISSDPDLCNLDLEEVNRVMKAVEESCDFWRHEDEYFEVLEVERAFAYVLYEDDYVRIIISGKIDLLINKAGIGNNATYKMMPVDHKTFSRDFEVPRLSNQFMNYCTATNSLFLLVNRIGLHDPDAKKPKPAEERFQRVILSYDADVLNQFKRNLTSGILTEYLTCVSENQWRMNFTSCYSYHRKCEYYEICETANEEERNRKLTSDFILASPWDVTAKLKKD